MKRFLLLLLTGWTLLIPAGELRVVSLAPNLTECIFLLGAEQLLVGRSGYCNYPSEAKKLPVVGGFGRPYSEALAAVRPTLVVMEKMFDPGVLKQLKQLGIPYRELPARSLNDYLENLETLGKLLNIPQKAASVVTEQRSRLEEFRRQASEIPYDRRPRVLVLLSASPLMAAGQRSYLHEIIELAGGRKAAESVSGDYLILSAEQLLLWQPELILLPGFTPEQLKRLEGQPVWEELKAKKIIRVDSTIDPDLLLRLGPRSFDAIEAIRRGL